MLVTRGKPSNVDIDVDVSVGKSILTMRRSLRNSTMVSSLGCKMDRERCVCPGAVFESPRIEEHGICH